MKRFFVILILSSLLLCSCGARSFGILSYQEKSIRAECTLNEEFKIEIIKENGGGRVSFLEPSELSYISFSINENYVTAKSGDVEITLENEQSTGILAIFNIFSLDEAELCTAKSENELTLMEFSNEYGIYTLTLGKNSLPKRVKIASSTYTFDISVDAISLS